jgi:hypothetical protein
VALLARSSPGCAPAGTAVLAIGGVRSGRQAVLAIGGVRPGRHGRCGRSAVSVLAGTAVLAIGGVWSAGAAVLGRGTGAFSVFREYQISRGQKPAGIPSALSRNITRKGQKFPLVWNIEEG